MLLFNGTSEVDFGWMGVIRKSESNYFVLLLHEKISDEGHGVSLLSDFTS